MGFLGFSRFLFGIFFLLNISVAGATDSRSQAKIYLKDYLKGINEKYPFALWEKQLFDCRAVLDRTRSKADTAALKFDPHVFSALEILGKEVDQIVKHRADVNILVRQLYASSLISNIEGRFLQAGNPWDSASKTTFQRMLLQYEAGSLKPKSVFLANAAALDRDYHTFQDGLLFAFAQDFLSRRVEEHLRNFNLAKIEKLYSDYSLQLEYWIKEFSTSATQTQSQLLLLNQKFEENKSWVIKDLENLGEVLNTEMLFSDLLEYCSQRQVDLTLEVEEKIEAVLKERNVATLTPIRDRIVKWKAMADSLRERLSMARDQVKKEEHQALAKADRERKEREQMEALQLKQQLLEQEQTAKFKETLNALRTFTFKTETSIELDDDSKKALTSKVGVLKTTYAGTASKKLPVAREKFSDTLAYVQKFKIEDKQVDFSKMSLEERSNQSAYTYTSPTGRTNQGDLENFVSEVALSSFSTSYTFLSYQLPNRWELGKAITWVPERSGQKAVQDREFSYVDLVVDAHRKRSGGGSTHGQSSDNLPANMFVLFDPHGAIIRFQIFADIKHVSIKPTDMVGGKVYFKFLNYSADRLHIYLNGIDGELKVGTPAGKS